MLWLLHNALSLTINLLCFLLFHTLPLFYVDFHTFLPLFLGGTVPFFLQISCLSQLSLCECLTCASPFSLCECHTNILVSPLLLSGQSTFFPFRSLLTHSRSYFIWTATPHFLNEKSTCPTSFLSFGNITNIFITTLIFKMQ